MDDYHIYDEIGRGKHSVVYKGRKKQTIEYVAVKSVDKALMAKVQNEVYMLHEFSHDNTLKFYNWYATARHVWLILEYCTGGDLLALLNQDKQLPESAIKVFGVDLMAGLQYVHSCGVICCDVKPSNVLIDEFGVLKLCGFGLATRVPKSRPPSDTARRGDSATNTVKAGTPCYMAPELFREGAVHSFASDLWSLGCVLYELRVGHPPFVSDSFRALVSSITHDDVAMPAAGSENQFSDDFADLIKGLLQKDPRARMPWAKLLAHPFWSAAPPPECAELPRQPAFEAFCASLPPVRSSDGAPPLSGDGRGGHDVTGGGDPLSPRAEPARHDGAAEAERSRSRGGADDVRATGGQGERAGRVGESRGGAARLSSLARRNIQMDGTGDAPADNEGGDLGSTVPARGRGATLHGDDIKLAHPDAELDFEDRGDASGTGSDEDDADVAADDETDASVGRAAASGEAHDVAGGDGASRHGGAGTRRRKQRPVSAPLRKPNDDSGQRGVAAAPGTSRGRPSADGRSPAARGGAEPTRPVQAWGDSPHDRGSPGTGGARDRVAATHRTAERSSLRGGAGGFADDEDARRLLFGGGTPAGGESAEQLVIHSADLAVRPIVCNPAIEATIAPSLSARTLPYEALPASEVLTLGRSELESHLTRVYKSLSGSATTRDKLASLAYCFQLGANADVANYIVNSSLMTLWIRMLGRARDSAPSLRARLALVMGVVVRHATFVSPSLGDENILSVLKDCVSDRSATVRRRAMSVLGELLFYIATQDDVADGAGSEESSRRGSSWRPPGWTTPLLLRCLGRGEDEIVAHYAAKTLENILAQSESLGPRLATAEIAAALLELGSTSRSENLRATCSGALVHLLRRSLALRSVLERRDEPSSRSASTRSGGASSFMGARLVADGLRSTSTTSQQAAVNLLNLLLVNVKRRPGSADPSSPALRTRLVQMAPRAFIPHLMRHVEKADLDGGGGVLAAKAALAMAQLIRADAASTRRRPLLIHLTVEKRLPGVLSRVASRLAEDASEPASPLVASVRSYLLRGVQLLAATVVRSAHDVLEDISHVVAADEMGGADSDSAASADMAEPLGVLLPLLSNSVFCSHVAGRGLAARLAECLQPGRPTHGEVVRVAFLVAEAFAQRRDVVLLQERDVVTDLLPALASGLEHESGDRRALCLGVLTTFLSVLLGATAKATAEEDAATRAASPRRARRLRDRVAALQNFLVTCITPHLHNLLLDRDPVPQGAVRLLLGVIEWSPPFAAVLDRNDLIRDVVSLLPTRGDAETLNASNVALVARIVESGEVDVRALVEYGLVQRVGAVVSAAFATQRWESLQQVADLMYDCLFDAGEDDRAARREGSSRARASLLQELRPWLATVPTLCRVIADGLSGERDAGAASASDTDTSSIVASITRVLLLAAQLFQSRFYGLLAKGRYAPVLDLVASLRVLPRTSRLGVVRLLRHAAESSSPVRRLLIGERGLVSDLERLVRANATSGESAAAATDGDDHVVALIDILTAR
mmetsp:Transcript_28073/g.97140  ORF Transcript_28073/g.97140 Transcript_28073/m.97140 type:complete len:1517 (-) Transcript_28073:39-4589(-)